MTGQAVHWLLAHAGPGNSSTNCSSEVYWRILKEAALGTAGRAAGGYSVLRMQSNLTQYIQNDSKASLF